jgi:cytochrome c5
LRTWILGASIAWSACADDPADPVPVTPRADDRMSTQSVSSLDAAVAEPADAGEDAAAQPEADGQLPERDAASSEVDAGASEIVLPTGLPCEVEDLVLTYCVRCHAPGSENGIPLTSHADWTAALADDEGVVADRAVARMRDGERPMPPKGEAPSEAEIQAVTQWIGAGMPRIDCEF